MPDLGLRVALVSLEPWDDVWRRNQHFAAHLVRSGAASRLLFLEPPRLGAQVAPPREVLPGICAVPLQLRLPKRAGGLVELGRRLRAGVLRGADVLWVNDPTLGVHCLRTGQPAVYDVTDDWRSYDFPPRLVRRIVRAEDRLARRATTVVCSTELQRRWSNRYGLTATVVHNGVDGLLWERSEAHDYTGPGPHVGYVGTLQPERLDIELVLQVADCNSVGRVHLVGPDALDTQNRERLRAHPKIALHQPVPSDRVASWTKGLDLLLSPHKISSFTLSLDAIKSYEYLASGKPVVATPTSGFQFLGEYSQISIAERSRFVQTVSARLAEPEAVARPVVWDWQQRADAFARALAAA